MKDKKKNPSGSEQITVRLDDSLAHRFLHIVRASKRSKTSVVMECLERVLPDLEKQYKQAA